MRSGMVVRIVVTAGFIAAAGSVSAQRQSQQPAPSPSPSPSPGSGAGSIPSNPTPGTPGRQPSPFPDSRQQQQQSQQDPFGTDVPRPIFLSGKVMLDDGTPAESVVIERVCNGNPRPEAYTDSKGHFSFQLGQNTAMMADASVGSMGDSGFGLPGQRSSRSSGPMGRGGVTEQQLMGCEIRAVLAGFRSDVVNLAGRRALDNPELGVIILHRMGNVEGTTISMTSLQAPKDAKKAYDKGREALKKNKVTDAEKELQKAVAAYPKYAIAWYELGRAQEAQNRVEDARKSYEQALAADAKYINPYLQLAGLSARDKKWQDVADTTARVIRLDPFDFPQAYFYNSVANYNLGKLDAAEKSAREAQKLDTQHRYPRISQLLGLILADRKDYVAAAQNMRDYLKFAPGAQDAATVRGQLTELERLAGVVKLEQQP